MAGARVVDAIEGQMYDSVHCVQYICEMCNIYVKYVQKGTLCKQSKVSYERLQKYFWPWPNFAEKNFFKQLMSQTCLCVHREETIALLFNGHN